MKIDDLDPKDLREVLKITDFEHFFEVYIDRYGNYSYNFNQNLYFKFDKSLLPTYQCKSQMFWPLISYEVYGTTRLAWLLMKLNDVQAEQMFDPKHPGDKVAYIPTERMQQIVEKINEHDLNG